MSAGLAPGAPWTEARVGRELTEFLRDAEVWPSYREFQNAGRGPLRAAVTRLGGARAWAERLSLPYPVRRPGHRPYWTEDRVETELTEFLRGRVAWPTRRAFELAGRKALRDAIGRLGGPARWAAAFERPLPDLKSGSAVAWTPERIESELRRVIGPGGTWPTRRELSSRGTRGLASAVSRHGGVVHWCQRLGVSAPSHVIPSGPRLWTDERIRTDLEAFCRGRCAWPTQREFVAAGSGRLYKAASRRGGVAYWASELGLSRRGEPVQVADGTAPGRASGHSPHG